jgi:hypothetical protein
MPVWPPENHTPIYQPPRAPLAAPSTIESKAQLAAARVREGLPAGETELEDVLARRASDDPWLQQTMFTRAEGEEMDAELLVDEKVQELVGDNEGVLLHREVGWQNGRRVRAIYLSDDQEDIRRTLVEAVGTDRLNFRSAKFTVEDTERTTHRIWNERDDLEAAGIHLIGSSAEPSGEITVDFAASEPDIAEQLLRERFGEIVHPRWTGATATHTFRAFAFGSWLCEDDRLTVFYGLPHNGEHFGSCQAFETERAVIVSLQILVPRGWQTAIGGFTPSHATVRLERPVGERVVIDDSANRVRSHWTQVERPPSRRIISAAALWTESGVPVWKPRCPAPSCHAPSLRSNSTSYSSNSRGPFVSSHTVPASPLIWTPTTWQYAAGMSPHARRASSASSSVTTAKVRHRTTAFTQEGPVSVSPCLDPPVPASRHMAATMP